MQFGQYFRPVKLHTSDQRKIIADKHEIERASENIGTILTKFPQAFEKFSQTEQGNDQAEVTANTNIKNEQLGKVSQDSRANAAEEGANQGIMSKEEDKNQRSVLVGGNKKGKHTNSKVHDECPIGCGSGSHNHDQQAADHGHDEIEHRQNARDKEGKQAKRSKCAAEGDAIGKRLRMHEKPPI